MRHADIGFTAVAIFNGLRFNGVEKNNVYEYNVAEGWVRVEVPTAKDRRGHPMVIKLTGTVEPYYRLAK